MKFGQWLGLIGILISLYILWQIRYLLLLIFTAVVFATALNSLVRRLHNLGIRRNLAVVMVLSAASAIAILFVWLVVPPFVEQFAKLIELLPEAFRQVRQELVAIDDNLPDWWPYWLPPAPNPAEWIPELPPLENLFDLLGRFFTFFSNSLTIALQLLLVLVLTLMMLANPTGYRQAFLLLFPSFYRRRADAILSECEVALGNWLAGIAINSLFIGSLSGIGLGLLQVDLVLVHALMAGLLNFVPNIGPVTSVVFPVMVALLDTPWKILAVLGWYFIIQNIESYWLTPTVMAKQVSLLPAITLLAQIFFATSFGILGLVLALPLAVVAKVWIEEMLCKDILDLWGNQDNPELSATVASEPQPAIAASDRP